MRAREPDEQGYVERDGVKIAYEVFGDGDTTVLFVPGRPIVHSRAWKAQVPYLARTCRVITVDPRGNGRSDRPTDPTAYGDLQFVADTIAVLDAIDIERAVLVGLCQSAWQALVCAALHPDRVQGVVAIGPWRPRHDSSARRSRGGPRPVRRRSRRRRGLGEDEPALLAARLAGLRRVLLHRDLQRAALDEAASRTRSAMPASRRQRCSSPWVTGRSASGDARRGRGAAAPASGARCSWCTAPRTSASRHARGANVAELTGGRLVTLEGSGHLPQGRDPVRVNLLLREFIDQVSRESPPAQWTRALDRRQAGPLPVVADRPGPCASRSRDRPPAA